MNTPTKVSEAYQGRRQGWRRLARTISNRQVWVSFAGAVVIISLSIARHEYLAQLQSREAIHSLALRYERLKHHVDSLQIMVSTIDQRVNFIKELAFGEVTVEDGLPPGDQSLLGNDSTAAEETDALSLLLVNIRMLQRKVFPDSIEHRDILALAKGRQKMYAAVPAIWPLADKQMAGIVSGFGMRLHPIFHLDKMHEGIDFAAPQGTMVFATAEGEVIVADTAFVGYGTLVIVDHGHGYQTRYAHLGKFLVKPGDRVRQGEVIAHVGNTGQSTASHLHYEVLLQGVPINPIHFLFRDVRPLNYDKLVGLAFLQNQSFGN